MFESLSQHIDRAIKTLKGQNKITTLNVAATVKDIRRALIQADVSYKVAKQVTDAIKDKALGRDVLSAVSPGQLFTKIVSEELTALMGSQQANINLAGKPAIILIAGLQGSGKTTCSGKLALYFKNQSNDVLLAACDIYRPAAINQLQVIGEQLGVAVYAETTSSNVLQIAQRAIQQAQTSQKQVVIIDTAGRLAIDEEMMHEITELKQELKPAETLFVVDAMTGQDAVHTTRAFNEQLGIDGVVLTKLDGDARGGAALSIRTVVDKPIKFISTGEKMTDLDVFYPDRMAKRILGMGDVISLVEQAEQVYDEQEARILNQKLRKNQFSLDDFLAQIQQIKKMGNLQDLVGMIPGAGKVTQNANFDEDTFKPFEAIICSMTPQERTSPDILNKSRRERIAKGSGTTTQKVNRLLKQFDDMRKMMKKAQQGRMKYLMKPR